MLDRTMIVGEHSVGSRKAGRVVLEKSAGRHRLWPTTSGIWDFHFGLVTVGVLRHGMGMALIPWNLQRENGRTVIPLNGVLDSVTGPDFGRFLEAELRTDDTDIVLEASGLRLISSAGLRELLKLIKRVTPLGGKVVVVGGQELVVEAIKIAGLGAFLLAADSGGATTVWGRLRGLITPS